MAEKEVETCFICENLLLEGVVQVKQKGIETFRQSSTKRNDGRAAILENKICISVHDACRKLYNNTRSIAACVRRGGPEGRVSMRLQVPMFPFKSHCFLCGNEITEAFLLKQKKLEAGKRDTVYSVRNYSVRDTVLQFAEKKADHFANEIKQRLNEVR